MAVTTARPWLEWPAGLDVGALRERGWRPTPFRYFVLKLHGRCNLACDYCYVYTMADQRWRSQPASIAPATVAAAARRITEHASTHGLRRVKVILHGGEPLLVGADRLAHGARTLRSALTAEGVGLDLHVQTNGVLLDERRLPVLRDHGIRVSVSLDGDRRANDRHRRAARGTGTHAGVSRGLHNLLQPAYRDLFAGLLCTVDLNNDPVDTYEALLAWSPPTVDFLLPHGNWMARPPGRTADHTATPYGDWLVAVFERWYSAPRQETGVRVFQEIINLLLGGRSQVESVGLTPVGVVVVETDGTIEQVGSLKSAFPGAPRTGLNVFDHAFDRALEHPAMVARQVGLAALDRTCGTCDVRAVCGGGTYAHRYRPGRGFRNPSVYCADLLRLIRHIRERVRADLDALGR